MTSNQLVRLSIVGGGFALALASIQPALSCHRYAHWRYPWPQACGSTVHAHMRIVADAASVEPDQRTPAEIADANYHDLEVALHHDEINKLMGLLRAGKLDGEGNEIK